jgi:hypothetical protein
VGSLKHHQRNERSDSDNDNYDHSDVENDLQLKQEKYPSREQQNDDNTMDTMENDNSLYDGEAKTLKITVKYEKHSDEDDGGFSRQVVANESRN